MLSLKQIKDYSLAEAQNRFDALTTEANATGLPFRILKDGRPWAIVYPATTAPESGKGAIASRPAERIVVAPDLDILFAGHNRGFVPAENGFSAPVGDKEL